jgi:hypothetical protein
VNLVDPDGRFALGAIYVFQNAIAASEYMRWAWLVSVSWAGPKYPQTEVLNQMQLALALAEEAKAKGVTIAGRRNMVNNAIIDVTTNILVNSNCRTLIEGALNAVGEGDHAAGEIGGILGQPGEVRDYDYDTNWWQDIVGVGTWTKDAVANTINGVIWLKPGAYDNTLAGRLIHEAFHVITNGAEDAHKQIYDYLKKQDKSVIGDDPIPTDPQDSRWISKVFNRNCG